MSGTMALLVAAVVKNDLDDPQRGGRLPAIHPESRQQPIPRPVVARVVGGIAAGQLVVWPAAHQAVGACVHTQPRLSRPLDRRLSRFTVKIREPLSRLRKS